MLPQRMCIACRKRDDRQKLLRIVKPKNQEAHLDPEGNGAGRGAYLCHSGECIDKAEKKRALSRALRCDIDSGLYIQLHTIIDGGEQNGC